MHSAFAAFYLAPGSNPAFEMKNDTALKLKTVISNQASPVKQGTITACSGLVTTVKETPVAHKETTTVSKEFRIVFKEMTNYPGGDTQRRKGKEQHQSCKYPSPLVEQLVSNKEVRNIDKEICINSSRNAKLHGIDTHNFTWKHEATLKKYPSPLEKCVSNTIASFATILLIAISDQRSA